MSTSESGTSDPDHCHVCRLVRDATPEVALHRDGSWVAFGVGDRTGWVMFATVRHGQWLWDMSEDEAAGFGPVLARLSAAIRTVCRSTHVYYFGLGENSLHMHGLLIPRLESYGKELQGATGRAAEAMTDAGQAALVRDALRNELSTP